MNSNMSTVIEDQVLHSKDILCRRLAPYVSFGLQDLQTIMRLDGNTPTVNITKLNLKEVVENIFKPKIPTATEKVSDVIVNGAENNDVPIEYTIKGLKSHELPVKGVYVHGQITPGFPYKVRYIGSERYMFGGEARCLASIGMGYGKRLTFIGDTFNDNDFFWSDSHPEGYAFSISAVKQHEKFIIYNNLMEPIGEAVVDYVNEDQYEESSEIVNGTVVKNVHVTLQCSMNFYKKRNHGLVDLHQTNFEIIKGTAVLKKQKRERNAKLERIENVFLGNFGKCSLHKES